jgi:CIC family chloride channel protein
VIIGMMALFGGIAHAPLAVMLMVAEMTGSLALLAPAMIAVAVATAVVGDETIYEAQLRDRAASLHHRLELSFPMLAALSVRDSMETAPVCGRGVPVRDAVGRLREAGAHGVAVVADDGHPLGAVGADTLERAAARDPERAVGELLAPVVVTADETLEDAILAQARAEAHVAAVTERGRLAGIATAQGMLAAYRAARARRGGAPPGVDGRGPGTSPGPG